MALAGTFGYELDVTKLSKEDKEAIPKQIATYKKFNKLIREGDYYRLASYRENNYYDCYQVVSKDKSEALITFVQVLSQPNMHSIKIKLQGLDDNKIYKISGSDESHYGVTLKNAGLLIERLNGDFQSKLIHLTEQ